MAHTNEAMRPLANYPQGLSSDQFLSPLFNTSVFESYTKQVEALKKTVEDMLVVPTTDPIEKIHLINSLCRLGVSYHFENEIEEQLSHLFITLPKLLDDKDYDLHTIAMVFQVFRFNRYKMPCGVFSRFQDGDGKFKEEVLDDAKGMVSLYEASHFRMNGEPILEEALSFTRQHLRSLANRTSTSPHLREYIINALFRAYNYSLHRYEAKLYISFYEKEEPRNDTLLKLAKYDFNRVQMMYQQELAVLSRWYKEQDLKSKFPYARHRVVEGLLYSIGMYFEPRYAVARYMLTKQACIIGLVDDTYEAYELYEELQSLTDAIERFDVSAMDELPDDNKRILYETLLNATEEAENLLQKEGRSHVISYLKDEWKKYVRAEQVQCRWRQEGVFPTFEEYLENGLYTSTALLSMSQIMLGIEEADPNAWEWFLNNNNKFSKAFQINSRLYNDIVTDEEEEGRGYRTGTACYMKQHKVSRTEAIRDFQAIIAEGWKEVNEGCMRPTALPMPVVRAALNYHRLLDFAYRDNDEYTFSHSFLKDTITKVLIDPIPIDQE
ncbi:hypothetical protein like AT3G14490 [Hibiscus trionum]|uniref:(+)-delta-cadinene synthase n=1 Tax=Hibiscus trionum TaxID=183268 RepID=A0A9W7IBW2_HIBTR|nr:hypothetical protein like AT3G14490 [Hibiscus trionum]